jgi:hypothetical protein
MDSLIIQANGDITPAVKLDRTKGIFEIAGWCHPEDAIAFYAPVFEWLKQYAANPNKEMVFHFNFQYYNTASAKQIFRLISLLEEIAKKSSTKIKWHHESDDTDMLISGERFSKMSTIPFEFIAG